MLAASVGALLCDARVLCTHVYGNFVLQHLLEHGEQAHRRRIVHVLSSDLKAVALDRYGGGVLGKALSFGLVEDQRRLAELVLHERGLLSKMACLRSGFAATQRLLRVARCDPQLLASARPELMPRAARIQRTERGRVIIVAASPDVASATDA